MREWEAATWQAGQTEQAVIKRVGKAIAQAALSMTPPSGRILLLAGKGHNGDDVRAAQPHLAKRQLSLVEVNDPTRELARVKAEKADLIIDGLFGIGLNRPLDPAWCALIRAINEKGIPILSVDVPSGLNADTGETFGEAIRATVTLTVGGPKRGMLQAGEFVGHLIVASKVGLVPFPGQSDLQWITACDFTGFPPTRKVASHKGDYGHLAIFAGSLGFHGAAILAARGAARAQPGLISLITEERVFLPVASQLQSQMVHPWRTGTSLPPKVSAILFGPGLAAPDLAPGWIESLSDLWLRAPCPVIVDASGLTFIPAGKIVSAAERIMTPHPGEAARLLNVSIEEVQQDRINALRELSRKFGDCRVVLKGYHTLIGTSSGAMMVNSSGNPFLAQGGSGDLLAGYLAGSIAQPDLRRTLDKTLSFAVWQHGETADQLTHTKTNWTVEDLATEIGRSPSGAKGGRAVPHSYLKVP